ncbi:alpha/beta hydrolase family protein [Pannonibacter sp.]|uniref:alpha/beta hydrolase family protein n=1 Tax=Pannonibacter sp. TaxID=1906786 RepID=UPI003F724732
MLPVVLTLRRLVLALTAVAGLSFLPAPGAHADEPVVSVSSGVSYQLIGRWDVDKLNEILTKDTPAFAGITETYTPATNAVRLYRVTYPSVIPEHNSKPTIATGLLAVPEIAATALPLVSYQHGTVYGRQEVPSFPDQSPETQLMIAQFAGQGYLLIGADYFGMGLSTEPEGYMVKASHQQATTDMLTASRAVIADMKLSDTGLFLAGWSQGGFVAMAMLEKLERDGVAVKATVTASAPLDVFAALNGFLNFPRKNDAVWVNSLFILSSFSFENYYGIPGLARSLFTDETYDLARKAYVREPVDPASIPTDLKKLIRPEYFDAQYFAASAYGRLIAETQSYRWVIKTPVRNYYGDTDEAITVGVAKMAQNYQSAMGAGNPMAEAISTGDTSHRGTFARAVPQWKIWFDGK